MRAEWNVSWTICDFHVNEFGFCVQVLYWFKALNCYVEGPHNQCQVLIKYDLIFFNYAIALFCVITLYNDFKLLSASKLYFALYLD